jgi:uncharacterized protein (TIGR03435 family)
MRGVVYRLAVIGATILLLAAIVGATGSRSAALPQNAPAKLAFEAASVRLFDPSAGPGRQGMFMNFGPPCGFTGLQLEAGRIAITAYTYTLISIAYGKPGSNCQTPDLLTGGPEWVRTDRYDVEATIPAGSPTYTLSQFAGRDAPAVQTMLQTLLADRFKLKVHREMKDVAGYFLTAAKDAKLMASTPADQPARGLALRRENGQPYTLLTARKATMANLANMLGGVVRGLVEDKTGITGEFNVVFEFDENATTRPTLAAKLQEIGLKLEPAKLPMEVVVIDSIERPPVN